MPVKEFLRALRRYHWNTPFRAVPPPANGHWNRACAGAGSAWSPLAAIRKSYRSNYHPVLRPRVETAQPNIPDRKRRRRRCNRKTSRSHVRDDTVQKSLTGREPIRGTNQRKQPAKTHSAKQSPQRRNIADNKKPAEAGFRNTGGLGRNRTGVRGFAGRCMTTLPPGQ